MTTFTDDQVKSQLETVLNAARDEGEARIKARDGRVYALRPVSSAKSPFDVPGVELGLTADEIVKFVREGRER